MPEHSAPPEAPRRSPHRPPSSPSPPWPPDGPTWGPPWAEAARAAATARLADPEQFAEWERRRQAVRLWVPFALSLAVQLGTTFGILSGRYFGPGARGGDPAVAPTWLGLAVLAISLAGPAALLLRRRWPGPIAAATAVLAVGGALLSIVEFGAVPLYVSVLFGVAGAVSHGARLWAWSSATAVWLAAVTIMTTTHARGIGALVPITILLVLSVAIPGLSRGRRERFIEAQRRAAQRQTDAAQAERLRIARELHDVLAHSLSLINVQASVGLHLFEQQPEQAREALATIKDSSKEALAEVRHVLGVLRADTASEGGAPGTGAAGTEAPLVPQPELSRLGGLAAEARTQGLEVEIVGSIGEAPQAAQSAIYRIVQEALTNVRKHAEATHVVISLGETEDDYAVAIADDGRGVDLGEAGVGGRGGTAAESGSGMLGMRERAELLGGSFAAGRGEYGGFVVTARIPRARTPKAEIPKAEDA